MIATSIQFTSFGVECLHNSEIEEIPSMAIVADTTIPFTTKEKEPIETTPNLVNQPATTFSKPPMINLVMV